MTTRFEKEQDVEKGFLSTIRLTQMLFTAERQGFKTVFNNEANTVKVFEDKPEVEGCAPGQWLVLRASQRVDDSELVWLVEVDTAAFTVFDDKEEEVLL